ncbi:YodC family protein [Erwinia sp. CGal63]|uniref:YodC family protein n=1 Tax=Erwinia sp. CGal63 TaxID=2919889 RepID=UPI00300AAC42
MILIGKAVQLKEGGPAMVVTGNASGMIECRWYDGYSVRREAFREEELCALSAGQAQLAS